MCHRPFFGTPFLLERFRCSNVFLLERTLLFSNRSVTVSSIWPRTRPLLRSVPLEASGVVTATHLILMIQLASRQISCVVLLSCFMLAVV